jgi:hypothetical protein
MEQKIVSVSCTASNYDDHMPHISVFVHRKDIAGRRKCNYYTPKSSKWAYRLQGLLLQRSLNETKN